MRQQVVEVTESEGEAVENYLNGEQGAMNYLVGCVLQETGGSINPSQAERLLEQVIEEEYSEPPEFPLEVQRHLRFEDESTFNALWRQLKDEDIEWENYIPDRAETLEKEISYTLTEDGAVELGSKNAVDSEDLY